MSTRSLRTTVSVAALGLAVVLPTAAASARPVGDPEPRPRPRPPVTAPPTPTPTPPPTVPAGAPRYRIEAVSFTADDESGPDDFGPLLPDPSDEPVWVFTSTDPLGRQATVSQAFDDVDTGETRSFGGRCLSADCTGGSAGPLALSVQLVESDQGSEAEIREDVERGLTALRWAAKVFGVDTSILDDHVENYFVSLLSDDLMGSANLVWSPGELAQALPAVGSSVVESIRLGESGGDLPSWIDNPPDYTLRLRVTRLADAPLMWTATMG